MTRWGILGAGNIAHRFAASLAREPECQLVAISGRNPDKLKKFGEQFGVPVQYTDHKALIEDPQVDAIYLALPHGMHREWAVKALEEGKPVLCEKPAVLHRWEMEEIACTAQTHHTLFMEAMKTRIVPAYPKIKEVLASGAIGEVTSLTVSICNDAGEYAPLSSYLTDPVQGGALWDCGIYAVSWAEDYGRGDYKVKEVQADFRYGVNSYVKATLEFENMPVTVEAAFDRQKPREAVFYGIKGRLRVEEQHRPQRFTVEPLEGQLCTVETPYEGDDFSGQIRHFLSCLEEGRTESPIMPLDASLRCADIIDHIRDWFQYTPACLEALAVQEEVLQYPQTFGAREALSLGNTIARMVWQGDYDREVAIQITREEDQAVLFQLIMDSKGERNLAFMAAKRGAVQASGHASIWDTVEARIAGKSAPEASGDYLPVGGAFPIRVKGKWVATLAVSGLHEGQDHALCIRALEQELGVKAPVFPAVLV